MNACSEWAMRMARAVFKSERVGKARLMRAAQAIDATGDPAGLLLLSKGYVSCHQPPPGDLMERVRAAIAKAEGR